MFELESRFSWITASDLTKTFWSRSITFVSPINLPSALKNWTLSKFWNRNLVDNKKLFKSFSSKFIFSLSIWFEVLFIITDVDYVYLNFNSADKKRIEDASFDEMLTWMDEGQFGKGTMEPKIRAALYFLSHHGKKVIITSIDNIKNAIEGKSGTIIRN